LRIGCKYYNLFFSTFVSSTQLFDRLNHTSLKRLLLLLYGYYLYQIVIVIVIVINLEENPKVITIYINSLRYKNVDISETINKITYKYNNSRNFLCYIAIIYIQKVIMDKVKKKFEPVFFLI